MPGNFDELIRQAMQRGTSPRLDDAGINPRDIAARQMNMQQSGVNSTAYAPQQAAPQGGFPPAPSAPPGVNAAQAQPSMDELISAQLGEQMPIPGARPAATPPPTQMGDASAMEATMQSPIMQQIAAQAGEEPLAQAAGTPLGSSPVPPSPDTAAVASPAAAPIAHPGQTPGGGADPSTIIAIVTALGGAAGISSLIQRYRMGDPDAARTFQAVGIHPDELAMFAGNVMPERQRGTAATGKQDRPKRSSGDEGAKKPSSQGSDDKASGGKDGKKPPVKVKAKF